MLVPDNCGQVVKKYLDEKTANGELKLNYQQETKNLKVRRPKKRLSSAVSVPDDLSSKKTKLDMIARVDAGKIDLGENVVEKIIQKKSVDKLSGEVVTKT